MKVYIYINPNSAVYLSGILSNETLNLEPGAVKIKYSTRSVDELSLMVSLTLDHFVWLQDQEWLTEYAMLLN
jgi:hypothetical protein